MLITEINVDYIMLDNKYKLSHYHSQDCCENVYADWEGMSYYPTAPLKTEKVDVSEIVLTGDISESNFIKPIEGVGFEIACKNGYILVSCYNSQNGYYSSNLSIVCNSLDDKYSLTEEKIFQKQENLLWELDITDAVKDEIY